MIKASTFILPLDNSKDWEAMGMQPPQSEEEEVDFYFHAEEVYTIMQLKKDRYLLTLNDNSDYMVKLTDKQIKEVTNG